MLNSVRFPYGLAGGQGIAAARGPKLKNWIIPYSFTSLFIILVCC